MTARINLMGVNVLLVEHRADHLEASALHLRRLSATVREARSAQEALDAYAAMVPDVIVSDLRPGVDGLGLMRRLRLRGVQVPAISVSVDHSPEARISSKDAGFNLHLAKPVTAEALFDAICQVLP
jgi:CheY-like chemotaxis protein